MGQVLTVCIINEEVKDKNPEDVIIFVDFSKVFNSIDRNKLLKILRAYGIPIEKIKAIMMFYNNTDDLALFADTCADALVQVLEI